MYTKSDKAKAAKMSNYTHGKYNRRRRVGKKSLKSVDIFTSISLTYTHRYGPGLQAVYLSTLNEESEKISTKASDSLSDSDTRSLYTTEWRRGFKNHYSIPSYLNSASEI